MTCISRAAIALTLMIGFVCGTARTSAQAGVATRRVAVLVGANAAPAGRRELRFALDDAQRVADTLRRAGRFAAPDVHVLLEPRPQAVLELLERLAAQLEPGGDNLLLFYYSGHSDGMALYPQGEALALAELREHLLRIRARVRVGILDTCRGGSWTQAKDLSLGPPLPAADIAALASEGNVLVAASAGFENAHEAEAVGGSFFTHHLSAALLGAADRSGDGNVTIQEAYEYARERTVRDSARYAPVPQHPSFAIDLRGRQDIVLTQTRSSSNALELAQTHGPLEVIQLANGSTIAESTSGTRRSRLVLPPGRYLIRRVADGRVYSKEVELSAGSELTVSEAELEAGREDALAMKGVSEVPAPYARSSSQPRGFWRLHLGVGVSFVPAEGSDQYIYSTPSDLAGGGLHGGQLNIALGISYAFTDRFTWHLPLPAFSYRFGSPDDFEFIPRFGLAAVGYGAYEGLILVPDAGISLRFWNTEDQSWIATFAGTTSYSFPVEDRNESTHNRFWRLAATGGYGWTIHNTVSIYLGVGFSRLERQQQDSAEGPTRVGSSTLQLGSVLSLGYRELPLLQVHLSRTFSLDARASWAISLDSGMVTYDEYLVGFTWDF
jgi:opacity protein-like surface antigen